MPAGPINGGGVPPPANRMEDSRRRELVDAALDTLRHVVGRDHDMPHLRAIVAGRRGSRSFPNTAVPVGFVAAEVVRVQLRLRGG